MTVAEATRISLVRGCTKPSCLQMAGELGMQLDPKYSRGAAIMRMEGTLPEYLDEHGTTRKRAMWAMKDGYDFAVIDRQACSEDIDAINSSMPERQGRPMSETYLKPQEFGPNTMQCPQHHVYTYGVFDHEGTVVAYLWLYRSGGLALVSSILGHADHLARSVMYRLWVGMLEEEWERGGTVFYNLWDSGTDGLRFFKERLGLERGDIKWSL